MPSRIHLVVGDTRPMIYVQLRSPDQVLDVSGSTVVLKFRSENDDTTLFEMPGELLAGDLQQDLIHADLSQYPVPGSGGRVRFAFVEGNLDLPPGRYVGEIEVTYGEGNVVTPSPKLQFLLREEFG